MVAPISDKDAQDISQALHGDYKTSHVHYTDEETLLGIPDAKQVSAKLYHTRVRDKLTMTVRRRQLRFLLPFLIKAEISPLWAVMEQILTWIVVLCGLQAWW